MQTDAHQTFWRVGQQKKFMKIWELNNSKEIPTLSTPGELINSIDYM